MIDPDAMVQAIADGLTLTETADRFGVTIDEVREAQKQALAAFSDGEALRLDWMLESKRLAACGLRFYQIAMRDADPAAAAIFIKASERRATLMGANAPAAASVKLIQQAEPKEHETTTQEMIRVLDKFAGITPRERELTDRHEYEGDNSPELLAELNELRTAREQARAARRSAEP
jgi:hypothetical protein